MESVHSLRKNGYKVWVQHHRATYELYSGETIVSERGGLTTVEIRDRKTDMLIGAGSARCSNQDNYNKKRGVQIALGRALVNANRKI